MTRGGGVTRGGRAGRARQRGAGARARLMPLALVLLLSAEPGALAELASGGGRIKGSVSGDGRKGLVAAHVAARTALPDRDLVCLTTTDETGGYLYESLPPGTYELRARAAGHAEGRYTDVEVKPPFRNILDFRLRPEAGEADAGGGESTSGPGMTPPGSAGGSRPTPAAAAGPDGAPVPVTGRIIGPAGDPVPDAEIAFSGGPPPGQRLVLSTPEGRFSLEGLVPDTYELSVSAPGAIPIRVAGVKVRAGRPLEVQVRLADYPLEMAARRGIILPPEAPLPPRRLLEIPPPPPEPPPAPADRSQAPPPGGPPAA